MIKKCYLKGSKSFLDLFRSIAFKYQFKKQNPDYFDPSGTIIFCGSQGQGKTISAVQYVTALANAYPKSWLCTNVDISRDMFPDDYHIIEYDGLETLKNLSNGYYGVIYLIDEIHLELNSLESQNIDVDIMTEISQQRKQRKHIVGTSQVYMRMAKPLREQTKNIVLCKNWFGLFQHNKLIDGELSTEKDGKLEAKTIGHYFWFHSPKLYRCYDTFAKMKRYNEQWKGRKRVLINE